MILETIPQPQAIDSAPVKTYAHLVTLVNRRTATECVIHVNSATPEFCDVLREVNVIRTELQLFGYDVFDAIPLFDPF